MRKDYKSLAKSIVISPSGNFYGSEQVLFDYLRHTKVNYHVYIPEGTYLFQLLNGGKHRVVGFRSAWLLYLRIFWSLLFGKFDAVYLNEAGHSKYIHLLAFVFRKVRFIIHVRILEDVRPDKWRNLRPGNTIVIAISSFIQRQLPVPSVLLYDLFVFPESLPMRSHICNAVPLQVSIIGRVSYSKGFDSLVSLADEIRKRSIERLVVLNLYGDISDDVIGDERLVYLKGLSFVKFHGYVKSEEIYTNCHVVLHLSKSEPLGRIFFEAVAFGIPFIGFSSGGIGEIAAVSGLDSFVINSSLDEGSDILDKLLSISHDQNIANVLVNGFESMKRNFSISNYVETLDNFVMNNTRNDKVGSVSLQCD